MTRLVVLESELKSIFCWTWTWTRTWRFCQQVHFSSDTATDAKVAKLLARYLRDFDGMDGDRVKMLACSFYPTGLGLGLGFFEEDLDLDLDLTVAGLVTTLLMLICFGN